MNTETTPNDIPLSDGRVVTAADRPSVDSWGSHRKILVGNHNNPRSWEVAARVASGGDLAGKMSEVAAREEALLRDDE